MLRLIAIVLLLAAGLVSAVFSRFAALLFYLWFALFRPQEWVWIDITPYRLSFIIGLMLVVPCLLTGVWPNFSHPLCIGMVFFLGSALVAQIGAVNQAVGWQWLDFMARLTIVCLLLVTLVSTRRRFVLAVAVIAGSIGFHTAKAGLASVLAGGVRYYDGLAGAFVDSNGYALATVMTMPLLYGAAQNLSATGPFERWVRVAYFLAVPLSAMTVVSTFSRSGLLALVAAVLAFVLVQRKRLVAATLLGLLLVSALLFVSLPKGYMERVETIATYDEVGETSALSRLHFWTVAIRMVQDRPLGIGLWNFESMYDRYDTSGGEYGRNRAAHSSHLQVLTETGVFGAVVWATLFLLAFRVSWRIRARFQAEDVASGDGRFLFTMANALLVSMTGFLVGGTFISAALNDLTWLTFSLVAALDRLSARMVTAVPDKAVVP